MRKLYVSPEIVKGPKLALIAARQMCTIHGWTCWDGGEPSPSSSSGSSSSGSSSSGSAS